jgi:hypothetical protein
MTMLLGPVVAVGDSLDEVLASYYEAIGGLDAWEKVTSCQMNGRIALPQGAEAPFTLTYQRPLRSRLEVTFEGMTRVQAYDGETAWAIVPLAGSTEPQIMPEEYTPLMREQADFTGPLIDWEAKGHQIELVGREDLDGSEEYHLKVTLDNGNIRHFFLRGEDYLPGRIEATTEFMGNKVDVETIFGDYREVGDVVMAHTIRTGPRGAPEGQVLTIETIELNIDVSDDLFSMPEPEEEDTEEEGEAAE